LVQKLHKGTLDLTVSTGSLTKSTATDCINLIHKNDAWLQTVTDLSLEEVINNVLAVLSGD
jgi:hypothetical protein